MQFESNILEIDNLSKYFGGLAAVSNCSLKIKKGTITGIIGPNGSGKTTLFNLIAGNLKTTNGNVFFNDENITNFPSYQLFSKGLLRTFQIAHEFTNLTVLENLMMVPGNQSGENLVTALFKPNLVEKEEESIKAKALDVIEFLNLKHLANELAGNLSGGQKQRVAIARLIYSADNIDLCIFDDPLSAVDVHVASALFEEAICGSLLKEKTRILTLNSHYHLLQHADYIVVMEDGTISAKGSYEQVANMESFKHLISSMEETEEENDNDEGNSKSESKM